MFHCNHFLKSLLFDSNNQIFALLHGIKYSNLTNNLYTIIWFKVTIYIYYVSCLCTFILFQALLSNTNNL